ncbi:hypothetical protein ACIN8IBEIGE_50126 [Acinetobacter sp. 8I-beige]|nr:hypothetical protein ACIN8IBEIGE_50126 [Acinetobacter sp. 8I-beige]
MLSLNKMRNLIDPIFLKRVLSHFYSGGRLAKLNIFSAHSYLIKANFSAYPEL